MARAGRNKALSSGALAVILASAVLALTACGSSTPSSSSAGSGQDLTSGGKKVANSVALLDEVDKAWRSKLDYGAQVGTNNAAVTADSRCYYTVAEGSTDVGPVALCGPVRHERTDPGTPWDSIKVDPDAASSGDQLQLAAAFKYGFHDQQRLPAGMKLFRPDGKTPPAELELPLPTPAAGS